MAALMGCVSGHPKQNGLEILVPEVWGPGTQLCHREPLLKPCLKPPPPAFPPLSPLYFGLRICHVFVTPRVLLFCLVLVLGGGQRATCRICSLLPWSEPQCRLPHPLKHLAVTPKFTKMFCFVPYGAK